LGGLWVGLWGRDKFSPQSKWPPLTLTLSPF
jgi:hypothetical protein